MSSWELIPRNLPNRWFAVVTLLAVVLCGDRLLAADLPGLKLAKAAGAGDRYSFEYSPDKTKDAVKGLIAYPAGVGPFKVVILNHGSGSDATKFLDTFGPFFLERDYAVLACSLASVPLDKDDEPVVLENQRRLQAALAILAADARINSDKVYIYGDDSGASAAINFLATTDKIKAAAVTGSGLFGKTEGRVDYAMIKTPVLILHGWDDKVSTMAGARRLKNALSRAPKPAQIETFAREGHDLPIVRRLEVFSKIVEFFQAQG